MAFSKPLALREYELRCHADRGRHHFSNHTKIAKDFPYHQDTRKSDTLSIAFLQYRIFVIEKMRPATGFSRRSEPAHPPPKPPAHAPKGAHIIYRSVKLGAQGRLGSTKRLSHG
jgi:hypothetical protein